jgi:hypothetical protein
MVPVPVNWQVNFFFFLARRLRSFFRSAREIVAMNSIQSLADNEMRARSPSSHGDAVPCGRPTDRTITASCDIPRGIKNVGGV